MTRPRPSRTTFALGVLLGLAGCDRDPPAPLPAPAAVAVAVAAEEAAEALARLRAVRGQVVLARAGRALPAADGGPLFAEDVLETGADAEAVIAFGQGRSVEVGPDARVRLTTGDDGAVVEVLQGFVLSRVEAEVPTGHAARPGGGLRVSILTPVGLTRLGAGSELAVAVAVNGSDAEISVRIGEIELLSRNGEPQRVRAGERVVVKAGAVQQVAREPERLSLEPMRVTVKAEGGRAEVRPRGGRSWLAVPAAGRPLAEGEALRVRSGRAVVGLEGSATRFVALGGAELELEGSQRTADEDQSALRLRRGTVQLDLSADRPSRVQVGSVLLQSEGGARVTVVKTKDGIQVTSTVGRVRLTHAGREEALVAGQVAEVGAALEVRAVEQAVLVLPSRPQLTVHPGALEQAVLTWDGEEGPWRVQVASDRGFEQVLLDGEVQQPRVHVELPRRGALYWRVFAAGEERARGSASFSPEPRQRDLERLRNEVPAGREKTTIFFQDKPPAVTFTFAPEPEAARYRVRVFRVGALDVPVADLRSAETRVALEVGVLAEGSYVWSVTPLSASGAELRGGLMNRLDMVYENSVPDLVITSVTRAADRRYRVTGIAPVGARLSINGSHPRVDEKNRFESTVAAAGRSPTLIFRMAAPGGREVYTVRHPGRTP